MQETQVQSSRDQKHICIPSSLFKNFILAKNNFDANMGKVHNQGEFFEIILDSWIHQADKDPSYKFYADSITARIDRNKTQEGRVG